MTKEEAIKWLIRPIVSSTEIGEFKAKELEAYELAIEALSEQDTGKLKNPCDSLLTDDSDACKERKSKLDLISRQDAIDAIENTDCKITSSEWDELVGAIMSLPSARPKGDVVEVVRCKDCGFWHKESAIYESDGVELCLCRVYDYWTKSDAYCNYGRRGEDDE